ncbi:MAG: NADP-dependent isocitrate dehydrogenase, partial [Cellulomonadaceae bacterium]|nr:NADP-dependent isocitrate dehydrogenase [Cellulomonadaceae bacterium]
MPVIYTYTDEAPLLATYSFLPIVQAFAKQAGVAVETADIGLAARILSAFPESLTAEQQLPDSLAKLGEMALLPGTNIIKLPNISASMPQLKAAIAELQAAGYDIPDYPTTISDAAAKEVQAKYDAVKGSAVNPVLRQGNSDRRAPASVKAFAKANPHRMGQWAPDSKTRVATMTQGDFFHNEASMIVDNDDTLTLRFVPVAGNEVIIRKDIAVKAGDVFDATFMSALELDKFLAAQVAAAKAADLLFGVHLKATMMKVSDPVIFGHAVQALLPNLFTKYGAEFAAAGISANDGLASIYSHLDELLNGPDILQELTAELAQGPALAMVNSDKGITAFHVPSDVIVDASMPALIRAGGKMWGADGKEHDTLAVIPDSTYAGVYQQAIADCIENGALDPATIGSVSNVGLMAMAAEEYGSHPNTFIVPSAGKVEVVSATGEVLISHEVAAGDIWRACLTRDAAISDWVKLGLTRGQLTGDPIVFWLDPMRPHDNVLLEKVEAVLSQLSAAALGQVEIHVMPPSEACSYSLARMRAGLDTISVTGNVLRDYLTDLFPILELGTSAKMLSIVPLMAGGAMFETGAGGTAPKHVQQLAGENYLRWDSLGEFLALAASFEEIARVGGNPRAGVLATTLDQATGRLLAENKSPSRELGGLDNRGSHFYLAKFWADALAQQQDDPALAAVFAPLAAKLNAHEAQILGELAGAQGQAVEL